MAKLQVLPMAVLLFLFLGVAGRTTSALKPSYVVQGSVYCDNCRAGFETTISEYIAGATVKLECRNATTKALIHSVEGTTDASGTYKLKVADNHEDEDCSVLLVRSPDEDCSEIKEGRGSVGVSIEGNSGMTSNVRYANSLGFLAAKPLSVCGALLAQYELGES